MAIYFHSTHPTPPHHHQPLAVFRIAGNCHRPDSTNSAPPAGTASRHRIQPFTCYLPFEQTSLFSSACALINSQSVTVSYPVALLTGVFISLDRLRLCSVVVVVVASIVIIFYAKSNKVNKNIAKTHTHTQRRAKGDRKKVWPCRVSWLLVWSATLATKECLRFIDFILVHSDAHTPTHEPCA